MKSNIIKAAKRQMSQQFEAAAASMVDVGVERTDYEHDMPVEAKPVKKVYYPTVYIDLESLETPLDDIKPGTEIQFAGVGVIKSRGERESDDGTIGGEVCFEIHKIGISPNA